MAVRSTDPAGLRDRALLLVCFAGALRRSELVGLDVEHVTRTPDGLRGTLSEPVSPYGLRAGFVTEAYRRGVPDEEIIGHTRHRSLAIRRGYVRRSKLATKSPAGKLGL